MVGNPNDKREVPPNTVVRTDGYFRLPRPARIDAFQLHNEDLHSQLDGSLRLQLAHQLRLRRRGGAAPAHGHGAALIGLHDDTSANRRNPDPNMWVGFGERSVDDMLQVWLDMVHLDDAEYQRLVGERKAKPASSNTAQPQP